MKILHALKVLPKPTQCRAHADNSNARCTKPARLSKYCFHHTDKMVPIISVILGLLAPYIFTEVILKPVFPSQETRNIDNLKRIIIGQAEDLQKLKRRPILVSYVNGIRLTNCSPSYELPAYVAKLELTTTNNVGRLLFEVANEGNIPADRLRLMLKYPKGVTNVVVGDQWQVVSNKGDSNSATLVNRAQDLVPPNGGYSAQYLEVHKSLHMVSIPMRIEPFANNSDSVSSAIVVDLQ